jgi:hypothetical protein
MLMLVSVTDAPRFETRYSLFIYPLLLVIGITVLVRWAEQIGWRLPGTSLFGAVAVLGWFASTEDFQPRHLLRIDSAEVNFRRHMSSARASHYYNRSDIRGTAEWLEAHATGPADLVISGPGVTALDWYYPALHLVYVDPSDRRLFAWSCKRGTVERWSNLPLVHTMTDLEAQISAHPRTFIAVAAKRVDVLLADLQRFNPRIVWTNDYGLDVVVMIDRTGGA